MENKIKYYYQKDNNVFVNDLLIQFLVYTDMIQVICIYMAKCVNDAKVQ